MKKVWYVLICVFLVLISVVVTFLFVSKSLNAYYMNEIRLLSEKDPLNAKVTELQNCIDDNFVGEYDQTVMGDAVAEAMIASTGDRWSYYISAKELQAYEDTMSNSYVGVGITVTVLEDGSGVLIEEVNPNGPAFEAGVLSGDILIEADGTSVAGLELTDVRNLVRGEENTHVVLKVLREGEALEFDLIRRSIDTPVVAYEMLDDKIGYIQILNFDSKCAKESIAAIEALQKNGAEKLLFDVRNNPGGYRSELVKLLDYLLPEGPLFRMKERGGEETVDYSDASCVKLPMMVLVNEDTYSAAEFFAAAIQEYGAGEVIGGQTCGKGYFQYTYYFSDGSAAAISSGTYCTPNGVSLANVGVTLDYSIPMDEESYANLYYGLLSKEDDVQLQKALSVLRGE